MPSTQEEWKAITDEIERKLNFPNVFAAADGKHNTIRKPANVVLLALVDHDYTILYADAGVQGRISDGGVFGDCSFNYCLSQGELNLPPPRPLPKSPDPKWAPLGEEDEVPVPFVIVADSAFPLTV